MPNPSGPHCRAAKRLKGRSEHTSARAPRANRKLPPRMLTNVARCVSRRAATDHARWSLWARCPVLHPRPVQRNRHSAGIGVAYRLDRAPTSFSRPRGGPIAPTMQQSREWENWPRATGRAERRLRSKPQSRRKRCHSIIRALCSAVDAALVRSKATQLDETLAVTGRGGRWSAPLTGHRDPDRPHRAYGRLTPRRDDLIPQHTRRY
jgi:hypothetical protein